MGFFGKREAPGDTTGHVDAIIEAPGPDPEKQQVAHDEDFHTALPQIPQAAPTIDPAVEARLLRKLDLRVPTLLGFLCKFQYSFHSRTHTFTAHPTSSYPALITFHLWSFSEHI